MSSDVKIWLNTCKTEPSVLELTATQPVHTVRIPTGHLFRLALKIDKGKYAGGKTISFVPRINEKYKLVYLDKGRSFDVKFLIFDRPSGGWKSQAVFTGDEAFQKYCKKGL